MASKCCLLVGNFFDDTDFTFDSLGGCFISVNNNINTEYNDFSCTSMLGGYRTGSLNLAGYASTDIYSGCPGSAAVQILWLRKYDCENDELHFIFSGEGRSHVSGNADVWATLNNEYPEKTRMLSASSQSGPSSIFTDIEQTEGLGMTYSKGPISFDTSGEEGVTLPNLGMGLGDYYLQNFRLELVPGSVPIANYTFAYAA